MIDQTEMNNAVVAHWKRSKNPLSAGIQQYFSRKFAVDSDFRDDFNVPGIEWQALLPGHVLSEAQKNL